MLTVGAALTAADASAAPCPVDSQERWFTYTLDAKHCQVGTAEGNAPRATKGRYYNVYCPGRMTTTDAVQVARALANGTLNVPSNRIVQDYKQTYNLVPKVYGDGTPHVSNGIVHLSHYGCQRNGTPGVATHFKVHMIARPNAAHIAKYAQKRNQSGVIAIGRGMEREYHLPIHIQALDKNYMPDTVGVWLLNRDLGVRSELKSKNARLCVMKSTDIQCSPCNTSDKLVVRTQIVEKGRSCPPDTAPNGWMEATRSAMFLSGYPSPMP